MTSFNARAKPYKLKAGDSDCITRDDIATWSYTILACARQIRDWKEFLPGNSKDSWLAKSEDDSHGPNMIVTKQEDGATVVDPVPTEKLKNDFLDFLTFVATHCPSGFMNMVMRESTSFEWILKQLHSTFDLETKGENFLAGNDLKFEFNSSFTYQQGMMQTRDFYTNSLLTKNSTYKGKPYPKEEELSPLAENFIVEKCFQKIDPRLPDHIKNTRGHLFTDERPTLACNQKILLSQVDAMLAELDGKEPSNINVGQVRQPGRRPGPGLVPRFPYRPQPFRGQPPFGGGRPPFRPPSRGYFRGPRANFNPQYDRNSGCYKCLEARRYDAAKFHTARDCTLSNSQRPGQNTSGMRVLFVQDNQTASPQPGLPAMPPPQHNSTQDTTATPVSYDYDQINQYGYNQDMSATYQEYEYPYQMEYPADNQGYYSQDLGHGGAL